MTNSVAARLDPDRLIEEACEQAGCDDFGDDDGWRDGLSLLVDGLVREADLTPLGVEIAANDVVMPLKNRLQVMAWRNAHRDVARERIERPIIIMGQPRTGTTILYDLLTQDPQWRAPLTWEVDRPCPPPQSETYAADPRIAETQASIDMAEQLMPGFLKFHPMNARVGQECVRITAGCFCSMIFTVQYRLPTYYRWVMYEADHAGAYRYHRKFLQHLQSGVSGQWLLKSPAHMWQLDKLLHEYPDAILVQAHRDPLVVIASISALTRHLRGMASDNATMRDAAQQCSDEIILGLRRAMALIDEGFVSKGQIIDLRFTDFMRDPFTTIRAIYRRLERELMPTTEQRMRDYLAAHSGDGGGNRYRWADTGLDAAEMRENVRDYQDRYDVPTEQLN
jgi:hypothetical protein